MDNLCMGILIPADMDKPSTVVPVLSAGDINAYVGGHFDCVRTDVDPELFGYEDEQRFVLVGHVHDEGLLLSLPMNHRASVMFQQALVGDVLVVSGTNPTNGEYDGDSYNVPGWYSECVRNGTLDNAVNVYSDISEELASAIRLAVQDGLFTKEEVLTLLEMMEEGPKNLCEEDREGVHLALTACVLYKRGRDSGKLGKFDSEGFNLFADGVTDEMISDFFDTMNGE